MPLFLCLCSILTATHSEHKRTDDIPLIQRTWLPSTCILFINEPPRRMLCPGPRFIRLCYDHRSTAMAILIVDDNMGIRELLTIFCTFKGYPAVGVANGAEALAYLQQQSPLPELILLDLTMPV